MRVSIVGLGFVGLTMAVVMANRGFKVIGVEIDNKKLSLIKRGKPPFFEPFIKELLNSTLEKNFEVTSNLNYAVENSDVIFVCVGTPSTNDGSVNLNFVKQTSTAIGKILRRHKVFKTIVVKSTVPPGTTEKVVKYIIEKESSKKEGQDFGICMNPEFLRESSAVQDVQSPHLIVIGTNDQQSKDAIKNLYEELYKDQMPTMLCTTITNSELIKYANNAFLATKISFINTIANICNRIPGANVEVIAKALGYDPRIGPSFLKAGPGYGGSCFPKDLSALLNFSKSIGYDPVLLESTHLVNQRQPYVILQMIESRIQNLDGLTFAILGISFKKNTDDIREAVSLKIIEWLLKKNVKVKVHDPAALENLRKVFTDKLIYCNDILECIKNTECCIILTEWDEYQILSAEDFRKNMKHPLVIDARRVFNPENMASIEYYALGYCEYSK